ncbi:MAG: type II toxin-antitoxin system YafQ family toxin [Clostridia bacterium]|nr:type II toxin-antitoxin system YafQ family toxin [Clostridia bacterium]
MLKLEFGAQFKKDYKLALKRGCDPKKLETVITMLANEQPLPEMYRDHALVNSRNYKDVRECHIEPYWLLVYQVVRNTLILRLIRTGTHSDLF